VALALGAAGLLAAGLALAAAGDLDPNFNGNGKRVIRIPPPPSFDPPLTSEVYGMALHKDGTIALALHFQPPGGTALAVMRLNPDGSTDPSFAAGLATLNLGTATSEAQAVAVQKDGKVVAAGAKFSQASSQLIVARFNQDGTLDAAFGKDGVHFGVFAQGASSAARAVAVQKDGKIVAAGLVASGGMSDFGVTRITRSGLPDPSFAGDGEVTTDFGGSDQARSVAIQPDGKILVGGTSNVGGEFQFALARYTRSGALDRSFGTGGKVLTDFGVQANLAGVAIQKDGKIVAAGQVQSAGTGPDIALARYTKKGSLDRSFGTDGKVVTDLGSQEGAGAAPAIQKDGRIVVAGSRVDTDENFLVARYRQDGQLDRSFSTDGWTTTDFGGGDYAAALGIDSLGRLVAAGTLGIPGIAAQGAVARYLAR
jgi:uncharacterized delta-60 repeat protein